MSNEEVLRKMETKNIYTWNHKRQSISGAHNEERNLKKSYTYRTF